MLNILTESERFTPEQLVKIEEHYGATYVCETCVKTRNGDWVNHSVSIFYQSDLSKVPEGGSQWFGLFFRAVNFMDENSPQQLCIINAISAVENDIVGIIAKNDDVIYSRYRHDYRHSPDGSVMIDGGRDYARTSLCPVGMVTLRIVANKLTIVKEDNSG